MIPHNAAPSFPPSSGKDWAHKYTCEHDNCDFLFPPVTEILWDLKGSFCTLTVWLFHWTGLDSTG